MAFCKVAALVKHLAIHSFKKTRHTSIPFLLTYFSCLFVFLHALSGAGYVERLPDSLSRLHNASSNQSTLRGWSNFYEDNIGSHWTRLKSFTYDDFSSRGLWHCGTDEEVDQEGVRLSFGKLCLADRFGPLMRGSGSGQSTMLGKVVVETEPRNFEFSTARRPSTVDLDELQLDIASLPTGR